ncbi:hypothetical protein NQD34_008949 [Periophthalmus magnuspinnatus]|nr:hypothetical protein NQD34_008949 [Periophthalmus magnuspinnatus]
MAPHESSLSLLFLLYPSIFLFLLCHSFSHSRMSLPLSILSSLSFFHLLSLSSSIPLFFSLILYPSIFIFLSPLFSLYLSLSHLTLFPPPLSLLYPSIFLFPPLALYSFICCGICPASCYQVHVLLRSLFKWIKMYMQ